MDHQSVSATSILCMCVSLLICFGVPIGLAIWGKVRYKKAFSLLPLLGGFLGFFISQYLIRFSALQYLLPLFGWYKALAKMPWLYSAFLAITAGLFEESARFIVFNMMKKRRAFQDGLSYGIGHGGTEAILLVGFTYINNIVISLMINMGLLGSLVSRTPALSQAALATAAQQLTSIAPATFLLGGFERLFTMAIQIALSIVVLRGFVTNRKWLYLALAVLLHAFVDFPAGLVGLHAVKVSVYVLEGFVYALGALSVIYIVWRARHWLKPEPEPFPEPADAV